MRSYVGPPDCPYCHLDAELIDSAAVYRKSYGMLWICQPCQAWVGVHSTSKSNRPKGTLAKLDLRYLRMKTHEIFDPLWKARKKKVGGSKSKARKHYYHLLARALKIEYEDCHIGMFDAARCRQVIELCAGWERAATEAAAQKGYPLPG